MTRDRREQEEFDHDLESFEPLKDEHQFDLDYDFTEEETKKTLDKIKRDMEKKNAKD